VVTRWHTHLGHPSSPIVRFVVSKNNLSCISESSQEFICGACQQGKSHQFPYPTLDSMSKAPLDLVFSDVWGPVTESVGMNKYYVRFIDDFSKFTCLNTNLRCFRDSKSFKPLLSTYLIERFLPSKPTGVVSTKS
jgi:hypothetical protein